MELELLMAVGAGLVAAVLIYTSVDPGRREQDADVPKVWESPTGRWRRLRRGNVTGRRTKE